MNIKRIFCSLAAALTLAAGASADEGMWLLPYLQQYNALTMKSLGCRLTPEQIYSINNSSLKDAVVQFGGGCTGEMISTEGLLVTNHHCGYSSIQGLSSDEHNYLEDGYWAMNRDQELPVPGLSVKFLEKLEDVTSQAEEVREKALAQYKDSTEAVRYELSEKAVGKFNSELAAKEIEGKTGYEARVYPFYGGNVYYLVVYKVYKDVRFVGAPPASVGKFGGETDNWMWPRHTGDFSMFRVYAGQDNEPAEYSETNVPYRPKQALKISLKGINEGDFTMIMGYPGSTQRFQTAAQLKQMQEMHDISVEARTVRQDVMWEWMEKSPSIRLKYANKYAGSANGWKKWIGQKKAFKDLRIIEREEQKEADLPKWLGKSKERKAGYGNAIEGKLNNVSATSEANKDMQLLSESVSRIELLGFANMFRRIVGSAKDENSGDAVEAAVGRLGQLYEDYWEPLDRDEAVALLSFYRERAKEENYLQSLPSDFASMDIENYVSTLFDNSVFTSADKLSAAAGNGAEAIFEDPAYTLLNSVQDVMAKLVKKNREVDDTDYRQSSKAFTASLMEWNKGKASYPDANFTMRLTYGSVKSYSPADAISYRYYTTIYGVIEKEDPDNYEFRVPDKLKELYSNRDYGQYAMADGNLPCCFLTNNDITGGNSGSPVLNADGELLGLAFDGNWESMSSDVMFEPDLQRCICVDIRYVLFLMDKLGGAGYLLDEMDIVR